MISGPPSVCKGCGETIISEHIVQALKFDWHPKCFRCSTCGSRLNNWYIQNNGNLYCRRDYWSKFGDLCNGCSQLTTGPVMVAGEHRYHPECFQCSMCQALIGDGESYALVERSFLYCGQCYRSGTVRSSSPVPETGQTSTVTKTPRRKPHSIQMVEIPPTPDTNHHLQKPDRNQHHQQQTRKEHQEQQKKVHQEQHNKVHQEQQKKVHQEQQCNLQLLLLATPFESGTLGVGYRNSLILDTGRPPPCVQISGLNSSPAFQDLAVGDRILEVDGTAVRDKTLEEINHLLTNYQKPVHVMVERDLSPLRFPPDEDSSQQSPQLLSKSLSRSSLEDSYSSAASDNEAAIVVQGTPVRLRPKGSLRAKGHSPSRRRSKSPSPCPQTRQKSIDLNRSHSFSTRQQDHRVFRAVDLILGEILGQGFFGQAIKATHRITGEKMVLKELHNFDEDAQKSFLTEVSMLRSLSHPCVLKFMGVLYRDKKLNLVTEFIDGGTLSNLLLNQNVELSWKQRVAFAKDIAAGMKYLHSMNVIHRDLNSQNCLVRKDFGVVVADFGLAKIFKRHENLHLLSHSDKEKDTNSGKLSGKKKRFSRKKRQTVVGNPYWMAPEMMTKGEYDEKVDVFSYGIIVCETIARVTADPDYLPRSIDFGLNVEAFHKKFCHSVPEPYFMLGVLCSQIEPDQRPSFDKIHVLCEALDLHVEHGIAVPTELQGSTVEFYRNLKESLYGKNYKDEDSCTQASSMRDVNENNIEDNSLTHSPILVEGSSENEHLPTDCNNTSEENNTNPSDTLAINSVSIESKAKILTIEDQAYSSAASSLSACSPFQCVSYTTVSSGVAVAGCLTQHTEDLFGVRNFNDIFTSTDTPKGSLSSEPITPLTKDRSSMQLEYGKQIISPPSSSPLPSNSNVTFTLSPSSPKHALKLWNPTYASPSISGYETDVSNMDTIEEKCEDLELMDNCISRKLDKQCSITLQDDNDLLDLENSVLLANSRSKSCEILIDMNNSQPNNQIDTTKKNWLNSSLPFQLSPGHELGLSSSRRRLRRSLQDLRKGNL